VKIKLAPETSDDQSSRPKVFISYSWTTPSYKEQVLDIADRMMKEDCIEVIIDEYDLKGGQDVVAFMEKLKTDVSITHVLIICDAAYVSKANGRTKGVGIEAQIVSLEVYKDIDQTRVLPIVMELTASGEPCLPTFLQSRYYFDFSSIESQQREWERLCRHLWGKPIRTKPGVGAPPAYLTETVGGKFVGLKRKWQSLQLALNDDKPRKAVLREELLDCFEAEIIEAVANPPAGSEGGDGFMEYWEKCLSVQIEARDVLLEWALTEARMDAEQATTKCLIPVLERINDLPRYSDTTPSPPLALRDAMAVLGYEMALYCTACLIEVDAPEGLRQLMQHPFHGRSLYGDRLHTGLAEFCHYSQPMEVWNSKQNPGWIAPIAHQMLDRCTHRKLGRDSLLQAEAVLFVVNIVQDRRWYPNTAVYSPRGGKFPWFLKAKSTKSPDRLAIVTGMETWQAVQQEFLARFRAETKGSNYAVFRRGEGSYSEAMGFA